MIMMVIFLESKSSRISGSALGVASLVAPQRDCFLSILSGHSLGLVPLAWTGRKCF